MDTTAFTIASIRKVLLSKEISATELTTSFLRTIETRDAEIHAFLEVTRNIALAQALAVDEKIARQEKLPALAGVPCALKDAIFLEGAKTTAGSRMLENYVAPYDATVTKKLKEAGAVLIGKTNMDEFGMGASTENSAFGPTKNPHDTTRVAGGSSGGSAASVAADEAVIALGEDTGGSIRQPASFCGIVGLKPTYGAVSRYGVVALASSLDQIGPFAKNTEDAETLFHVIQGKDALDATSADYAQDATPDFAKKKLRVGVPQEYFAKGLDPAVEQVIRKALELLEKAGVVLKEIHLPHTQYALAAYYIINMSEASANLARYDSIRYGFVKKGSDLLETYVASRGEGLGAEVKRRIMLGTYALSAGYYDAYYLKAQKVRTLLLQDFTKAFESVDVIAGPTCPFLPYLLGERMEDPLQMYLGDIYTVPVNLTALPAISLPAGQVGSLPVGLQLIAPACKESTLFAAGKFFESL